MVVPYEILMARRQIYESIIRAEMNSGLHSGIKKLMPDSREISRNSFQEVEVFIDELGRKPFICIEPKPRKIGVAGFDLRIGTLIAHSDTVICNVTEQDLLEMDHEKLEAGQQYILNNDPEGNEVYYITSFEKVGLSQGLELLIDSKSTTGRVGAMSHGVGKTKDGKLITIIQPFAFPLKISCGVTELAQAVVRNKDTSYMNLDEIKKSREINLENVCLEDSLNSRGLTMKFATNKAYKARQNSIPIDMDARNLAWQNYFELIGGNSELQLEPKTLYLLGSQGIIDLGEVCGLLSREQDVLTGTGTWGHFAGIFQPFFRGGITMEVYSYSKRRVSEGDKAGTVMFDRVEGVKNRPNDYGGSYQNQVPPLLPKMFKIR